MAWLREALAGAVWAAPTGPTGHGGMVQPAQRVSEAFLQAGMPGSGSCLEGQVGQENHQCEGAPQGQGEGAA